MMMAILLPGNRSGFAIVQSQELQIQDIDHTIIIQIGGSWNRGVVAHPNRQGVQLINDIVVINVTRQQSDAWHRAGAATGQRHRALGAEEPAGCGTHGVAARESRQAEGSIAVGCHRSSQRVIGVEQTDGDWLAGMHLSGQRP